LEHRLTDLLQLPGFVGPINNSPDEDHVQNDCDYEAGPVLFAVCVACGGRKLGRLIRFLSAGVYTAGTRNRRSVL
jgi:hypothetical protein